MASRKWNLSAVILLLAASVAIAACHAGSEAAATVAEETRGPGWRSVGALTFSPEGTLFVGDSFGAAVYALEVQDPGQGPESLDLEGINRRVASLLGTSADQIFIHDLAAHPSSRNVYLTASRGGTGRSSSIKSTMDPASTPHLIRVSGGGKVEEVGFDGVSFSKAELKNPPPQGSKTRGGSPRRSFTILEMAFSDGELYVSGMSNEDFDSTLTRLPYPFGSGSKSNGLKIFHTAHGRYETGAPARVLVPFELDGDKHVFAGFSCTPLVDFSLKGRSDADRIDGRTVAELGPGNHVLDMIRIEKDGQSYFLLANHLHPFMMLPLNEVPGAKNLDRPTSRAGITRTPLSMKGVLRVANFGDDQIVLLQSGDSSVMHLKTVKVEAL